MYQVNAEDSKKLMETVIEVEATKQLYDEIKTAAVEPSTVRGVLDAYLEALKKHKTLWLELLRKYVTDDAQLSNSWRLYRFNRMKSEIIKVEIEGCKLCKPVQ